MLYKGEYKEQIEPSLLKHFFTLCTSLLHLSPQLYTTDIQIKCLTTKHLTQTMTGKQKKANCLLNTM